MALGESNKLKRILETKYTINPNRNMDPTGGTIRDVQNLQRMLKGITHRPIYVETTRGAVQVNRCSVDDNMMNLYYNDDRIRTLPYSKGRLDHAWRFYPEKLVFARDSTKNFLLVYDYKVEA